MVLTRPGLARSSSSVIHSDVTAWFPEMRALMHLCRYSNCTHSHEPGCEVIKAVEEGRINPSRYENYLGIFQGKDWNQQ
jgi:ribosome biogenesis GTPase